MVDKKTKVPAYAQVAGSVKLLRRSVEGKELFAFSPVGVAGPCDGKMDGTSCGPGCTCLGGQPWYDRKGLSNLGVALDE